MSQALNLLLVSGPASGGIRTHLEALVTGLPERGCRVRYAGPESVRLPHGVERQPFEIGDRPRPLHDFAALHSLRGIIAGVRPDVVHAHGLKAGLLAALGVHRRPFLITFHNLVRSGPLANLARRAFRSAHGIAVSGAVQDSLTAAGITMRSLTVIPCGVDLHRFAPLERPIEVPPCVAFAGRLTEEKGVPVVLEVARCLQGTVRIVVAGDGPLRPVVEAAAAAGSLEYLGPLDDLVPFYHTANMLLAPSHSEGQGLAVVEAMACGLPVIASRVGGLAEVVADGKTGVLLPVGDVDAMVSTIRALVADPALMKVMGEAGHRRAVRFYSQDRMLDRLAECYRSHLEAVR